MSLNLRNHSTVTGSQCFLTVSIFFVIVAELPRPWMKLKLLSTSLLRASIAQRTPRTTTENRLLRLGARKSVLLLAARLKVAFKNCGLDKLDISKDFQKWLVFAAASVISNKCLKYGEELMKIIVPHGGCPHSLQSGQGDLQERPRQAIQHLQRKDL